MTKLKVLFYGDDFTGSSENLAQFHRSGLRAKLYLAPPEPETLRADAVTHDVLGLAGTARALAGDALEAELTAAYTALSDAQCSFFQYKVCSTFDSAPDFGNFGTAIDTAARIIGPAAVSVLAACPDFGRYTCFGTHFARYGEQVLRLDRHPSMSVHPATPMQEADLRLHLSAQTDRPFDNITLPQIRDAVGLDARIAALVHRGTGTIFDAADNDDLAAVARALWARPRSQRQFALAAQGLAQALGALWVSSGEIPDPRPVTTEITPVDRLLVLSGSCALQTGRQIDRAEAAGWALLHLDPVGLPEPGGWSDALDRVARDALTAIERGRPAVIYTARGLEGRNPGAPISAAPLGAAFAALAARLRERTALPRIVFSGGDSSSFAVKTVGAEALEISVFDAAQNSHVCRLLAKTRPELDGLEVMLKGGQVGQDDYFLRALHGSRAAKAA